MTPADFYRAEAARCRDRAERSTTHERIDKWRARAEQYELLARELDSDTVARRKRPSPDTAA